MVSFSIMMVSRVQRTPHNGVRERLKRSLLGFQLTIFMIRNTASGVEPQTFYYLVRLRFHEVRA